MTGKFDPTSRARVVWSAIKIFGGTLHMLRDYGLQCIYSHAVQSRNGRKMSYRRVDSSFGEFSVSTYIHPWALSWGLKKVLLGAQCSDAIVGLYH